MPHDIETERALVQEATARLIRTVDRLPDTAFAEPSALPEWTRGHVIAHLVLNAEGLTGVLRGLVSGEPAPMYTSQRARDGDIAALAESGPAEMRSRLLGGSSEFDGAAAAVPAEAWSTEVERTAGGPRFVAANAVGMRLREVEIHHVDLDAGHTPADWSPDFCRLLLDAMAKRGVAGPGRDAEPFVVDPTDLDGRWTIGSGHSEGSTSVTGPAAALGWWLTGRGSGDGLASSTGTLPEVASW